MYNECDTPSRAVGTTHPLLQGVGVFTEQGGTDDAPLVLGLLEVRVREQEEHLRELRNRTRHFQRMVHTTIHYLLVTMATPLGFKAFHQTGIPRTRDRLRMI